MKKKLLHKPKKRLSKEIETGVIATLEIMSRPNFLKVCKENRLKSLPFILEGGEDYELLFTLPSDGVKKLSRQFEKAEALVTHIGEITKSTNKVSLLKQSGKRKILRQSSGFNHF